MALPTSIELLIVTPERMLVRERVDEVQVPGVAGYFDVLPGHTPLLAALSVGELWYRQGQDRTYVAIAHGFAEILPDKVTILAQLAEHADEIDIARAEAAQKRAAEQLSQASEVDYEHARLALAKSLTRLQVSARIASGAAPRLKRLRREG